jgi:hypothetical protein
MKTSVYIKVGIAIITILLMTGTACRPLKETSFDLVLEISTTKAKFTSSGSIEIEAKLTNRTKQEVTVLNFVALENYPYYFDIIDKEGKQIRFMGPEITLDYEDSFFTTLLPGENKLEKVILNFDSDGKKLYDFAAPGQYTITGFYRAVIQNTTIKSNTITIILE